MKPNIKETLIDEIEVSDLDLVVEDELLGVNPDGHEAEWFRDNKNQHNWEEHISIKTLEDTIKVLKEKGATYIQIDTNHDHHAYIFTGTKLDVVSDKEIKEREKEKLKSAIQANEISLKHDEAEIEQRKNNLIELKKKLEGMDED